MKISSTSERLKEIMSERKIKQVDILEMCKPFFESCGVSIQKSDLSQYVSGKTVPKQDKLSLLSEALDVSEAWLMGWDVPRNDTSDVFSYNNIHPIKLKKFPLLGEIACGEPIWADEDKESYIMADMDIDADFCLKANGNSMINARIQNGDIVFIKQMEMVRNGEIAAVVIDNEATLKRVYYYPDKNKLVLNPENPDFEPLVYINEELDDIRILGKAVYFMSVVK